MRCLKSTAVLPLLTLLVLPLAVQAQVYKWRDAAGNIHYGDQPPAGTPAQPRKLDPANAASAYTAGRQRGPWPKPGWRSPSQATVNSRPR